MRLAPGKRLISLRCVFELLPVAHAQRVEDDSLMLKLCCGDIGV